MLESASGGLPGPGGGACLVLGSLPGPEGGLPGPGSGVGWGVCQVRGGVCLGWGGLPGPGGGLPGPGGVVSHHALRQTPVKTLPWPQLRCGR